MACRYSILNGLSHLTLPWMVDDDKHYDTILTSIFHCLPNHLSNHTFVHLKELPEQNND